MGTEVLHIASNYQIYSNDIICVIRTSFYTYKFFFIFFLVNYHVQYRFLSTFRILSDLGYTTITALAHISHSHQQLFVNAYRFFLEATYVLLKRLPIIRVVDN